MKHLILVLSIILCASQSWARMGAMMGMWGGAVQGSEFSCSCTGGVTFCWEVTANNSTITSSGGCSVGDTTATMNNSVIEAPPVGGGLAISNPTAYDGPQFSVSNADLINIAEGTIEFEVLFPSAISAKGIIYLAYGNPFTQNVLRIETKAAGEICISYKAQDDYWKYAVTSGAAMTTNTWYVVTAKWRQGSSDPSLSISVNGAATGTTNDDLTPTTFTSPQNLLYFGDVAGSFTPTYLRKIKIWNTWQ